MAYFSSGGIFSGLDDNDPVLSGYGLRPVSSAPTGFGLAGVPSGTTEAKKNEAKNTYYYLYNMAALAPKLRGFLGLAAGASIASVVTGGLSLVVAGAGAVTAMSIVNGALEVTLWWQKSTKDRDNYIKTSWFGEDIKAIFRSAARRLDAVAASGKTPAERSAARARAYFEDFIAVGPNAVWKTQMSVAQQAAFGEAYLKLLARGRPEKECLEAGKKARNAIRDVAQTKDKAAAAKAAALKAAADAANKQAKRGLIPKQVAQALTQQAKTASVVASKEAASAAAKVKAAAALSPATTVAVKKQQYTEVKGASAVAAARRLAEHQKLEDKRKRAVEATRMKAVAVAKLNAVRARTGVPADVPASLALPPVIAAEIKTAEAEVQKAIADEGAAMSEVAVSEQQVAAETAKEEQVAQVTAALEPSVAEEAAVAAQDSEEAKVKDAAKAADADVSQKGGMNPLLIGGLVVGALLLLRK